MALAEILITSLGKPLAKILLKRYLGEPADQIGLGLIDIAQKRITDFQDQKEAKRQFERLGDKIVQRLMPLFQNAERRGDVKAEAVCHELAKTLEGRISAEFFMEEDLDPSKLAAAFREARSFPEEQFSEAETSLYQRALDESVRYLVSVASRLPEFKEKLAGESLKRLNRMSDDLDEVLETTQRIEQRVDLLASRAKREEGKEARYEADYRQAVLRNLDFVELFGADLEPESRRQKLSVAYVSLNINQAFKGRSQFRSLTVEQVLSTLQPGASRLLVRGEAGSGKSTLFRWIAIQAVDVPDWTRFANGLIELGNVVSKVKVADISIAAEMKFKGSTDVMQLARRIRELTSELPDSPEFITREVEVRIFSDWRERIPFLIRLRDYKGGKLPTPREFPLYAAKELDQAPADWVKSVLQDGRALVLIDGIDEVPNLHRSTLKKEIEAIIGAYPDNYFLLSTRPTAVPEDWLRSLDFREGTIDPMSEADKAQFIKKWHEAVKKELESRGQSDESLDEMAEHLIAELGDNPSIARLANNPLLCAMICALHRDRQQKLPESQSELCEAICHMLLHRRERESKVPVEEFSAAYRELSYEEKRAIVQDIAHYMVRNEESSISMDQAVSITEEVLDYFPGKTGAQAQEVVKQLIERSGVLRESRPKVVEFIHNTIKEFLAAEKFAEKGDFGMLSRHIGDPHWQPVILFAVSTRKREFASDLLKKILNLPQKNGKDVGAEARHEYNLFALQCRARALHLDPDVEKQIRAIEETLFPPRTMTDAEALAAGGDAVVERLAYRTNRNARETAVCIRVLRLIGTTKAKRVLQEYLKDKRKTVLSELVQAVNPLETEYVRDLLLQGKQLPDNVRERINDVRPLVTLTNLQELDLRSTQVSDVDALSSLPKLQVLDLSDTQVSDVSALSTLPNLQSLYLNGTQVSDVSALSTLPNLQLLSLWDTQVSDVSPLSSLINLKELNLGGTRVSDVSALSSLTDLQILYLGSSRVSDVSALSSLKNLRELILWGTEVSDVSVLSSLTNLQTLDLMDTNISDVSPLSSLTNLQWLDLMSTNISDVSVVSSLTNLEELILSDTQVSDASMLSTLTNLKKLDLRNTQVSDVSALSKNQNLTIIGVKEL